MLTKVKMRTKKKIGLEPETFQELLSLSSRFLDLTDDILEERADYRPEFVASIKQSLAAAKQGKLRRIDSLKEL